MSIIRNQSAATARSSSTSSSGCFPCRAVRRSPEEMETNQIIPVEKPHTPWIKCPCLRNALELNLSRAELESTGNYSHTNRNELISDSVKLLSFLKRAQQTVITTKSHLKQNELITWSHNFLLLNRFILNSRGQSKDFYCVELLDFISQQKDPTLEDIADDVNFESAL